MRSLTEGGEKGKELKEARGGDSSTSTGLYPHSAGEGKRERRRRIKKKKGTRKKTQPL